MKIIENVPSTRFSNAYHVSFFQNVKVCIDKFGAERLGLDTAIYKRFTDAVAVEQDIVNRARSSALTRQLAAYDEIRDNYFRRIWYKLKAAQFDTQNPAMTQAIQETIRVQFLETYPITLTANANQVETAKIRGLILDLNENLMEQLEMLDIEGDIAILENANQRYEQIYMERNAEKNASLVTKDCREATEQAYMQVAYSLAVLANSTSSDAAEQAKYVFCGRIVDEINLLIKDFRVKALKNKADGESEEDIDLEEDVDVDNTDTGSETDSEQGSEEQQTESEE